MKNFYYFLGIYVDKKNIRIIRLCLQAIKASRIG